MFLLWLGLGGVFEKWDWASREGRRDANESDMACAVWTGCRNCKPGWFWMGGEVWDVENKGIQDRLKSAKRTIEQKERKDEKI